MPDIDPATSPEGHAVQPHDRGSTTLNLEGLDPIRGLLFFFCLPNGMEVTAVTATSCQSRLHVVSILPREPGMLRRPSITSDECRSRAEEAQTLAAQTQDDWERELFQRIATQWQCLVVHKKGKEENTFRGQPR